jgi:hypothetical protein
MTLNTILRFSRATTPEELFTGQWQSRATKLDAYKPYLDQRWQEGCTNAWKLWEEIKEQGYPHGYGNVRNYVSRILRGKPQPIGPRPPSARAVTRWILTHPDALPEDDRLHLKAVLANCPELTTLAKHVRSLAHMLTNLQGDQLPEWIESGHRHHWAAQSPQVRPAPRTRSRRRCRRPFTSLELWSRGGPCQSDQDAQAADVRPRWIRTPPQASSPHSVIRSLDLARTLRSRSDDQVRVAGRLRQRSPQHTAR